MIKPGRKSQARVRPTRERTVAAFSLGYWRRHPQEIAWRWQLGYRFVFVFRGKIVRQMSWTGFFRGKQKHKQVSKGQRWVLTRKGCPVAVVMPPPARALKRWPTLRWQMIGLGD